MGSKNELRKSPRMCTRVGCHIAVKKSTAKYCSVQCCALDPKRRQKLSEVRQRVRSRNVLKMQRQLLLFDETNPEALLSVLSKNREDVPGGMSRLTG